MMLTGVMRDCERDLENSAGIKLGPFELCARSFSLEDFELLSDATIRDGPESGPVRSPGRHHESRLPAALHFVYFSNDFGAGALTTGGRS